MSLARSVHRLDIAAPSAALARRAGLLVEDALRTASLPGDGAELVLVRRLDLPAFAPGVSAQGVAIGLESACRALAPVSGRDADDAALAAARAVHFADALEAHLALSARLLAGRPARAWCWALAVPGYRPDAGIGAGLRSIALSLARGEAAATALPHWFARIVAWAAPSACCRRSMPTIPQWSHPAARPAARPRGARRAIHRPGSARWHGHAKSSRATIRDAGCWRRWLPDEAWPGSRTRVAAPSAGRRRGARSRAAAALRQRNWRREGLCCTVPTPSHPPRHCARPTHGPRQHHPPGTQRAQGTPSPRSPPLRVQARACRR